MSATSESTASLPATPADAGALEFAIASLKANALAGTNQMPLRGRNVGILCADPQRPEVFMLQRAASELGARVALVPSRLDDPSGFAMPEQTARVLGRLYDALICIDVPARIVQPLREAAGIPVVADVAADWIALRAMRPDAGNDARFVLQALLIAICS